MKMGGHKLDMHDVKIPVYNLAAREDHIAPAKSVFVGSQVFGGEVTYVMSGSGHIAGVVNPPYKPKYSTGPAQSLKAISRPGSSTPLKRRLLVAPLAHLDRATERQTRAGSHSGRRAHQPDRRCAGLLCPRPGLILFFDPPLVEGRLISRYKRFLFDAELEDGTVITGNCPNTGSMLGLTAPGSRIFMSVHDKPGRKYAHQFEMIEADGTLVGVNTGMPNRIAEEAILTRMIPSLAPIRCLLAKSDMASIPHRYPPLGRRPADRLCRGEERAFQPNTRPCRISDTKTERGAKHLKNSVTWRKPAIARSCSMSSSAAIARASASAPISIRPMQPPSTVPSSAGLKLTRLIAPSRDPKLRRKA